ncbi:AraC family transcriptional regulator [Nannocystaceae bacterium ST9]
MLGDVDESFWTPVDPLAEVLHLLRLTGTFYCRSELSAPWGLTMPAMPGCLWFHVVSTGRCVLAGDDFGPLELSPGDFVLVSRGSGHVLRTSPEVAVPVVTQLEHAMVGERYALLKHGGGGPTTSLVCGIVRFDQHTARDLVELLPPAIHLDALSPHSDWMEGTLRMMAAEARQLRPGGETIVTRLADVLVIQAIRAWLQSEAASQTGWLGAMHDEQIGRALARVHREPARAWTVEVLAREVGMSRSAFAARFVALVGESPMRWVARQRMRVAGARYREGGTTLGELAQQLGYQSEAAFSRAFKRVLGCSPGAFKRATST